MRDPILVTGAHRSGTTWVGKTLAQDRDTGYIHEPFNIEGIPGIKAPTIRHWFHYVGPSGDPRITDHLRDLLRFRYPIVEAIRQSSSARDIARIVGEASRFTYHRIRSDRPLVKDPIAVFSAPWIAREFRAQVVALVRHPAAFAGSLKAHGWDHPFSHFREQPSLMEGPLEPFASRIERAADDPPDIIDQAILLWNCIYSALTARAQDHGSWRTVRHEDLARDPQGAFEDLYDDLDLAFSEEVRTYIAERTSPENPVTTEEDPGSISRDSRRVIWSWRDRLTEAEQERVRKATAEIASTFYDDSDWHPPDDPRPETLEDEP